jgi:hypothetical protein
MRSWFEIVGDVGSTDAEYVLSQPSNDIYSDTGIVLRTICALIADTPQAETAPTNPAGSRGGSSWDYM